LNLKSSNWTEGLVHNLTVIIMCPIPARAEALKV